MSNQLVLTPSPRSRMAKVLYVSTAVAWAAYILLILLSPNDPQNTYKLGLTLTNFIRVTFAVPVLAIWLISARAVVGFANYARLVASGKEGAAFRTIARGLTWLLVYLISVIMFGRLIPLFNHTDYLTAAVFINNHLPVVFLVTAFIQLYYGSTQLIHQTSVRVPERRKLLVWFGYCIFSLIFVLTFMWQGDHTVSMDNSIPTFAVSHNTLIFTLILPSLMAWILGLIAAINLSSYAYYVQGIIYKAALRSFVQGVYASIIFTILTELLILNTPYLAHIGLVWGLIILYSFLLAYAIGAVLIDRGARRLSRIEVSV